MGGKTKPQNGNFAPKRRCTLLRLRSARAQRATPARSAAYGDAKRAYFGPFGPDFVKRIERSSVGATYSPVDDHSRFRLAPEAFVRR